MKDIRVPDRKILIVTGHYGCGKTSFSASLALHLRALGFPVTVADLDIVNPYFRTADFQALFDEQDIRLIVPPFANTNLDLPVLSAAVEQQLIAPEGFVILDVGGDDAGATALGRFASLLTPGTYELFYVFNSCRYLTQNAEEACGLLRQIETTSRLQATQLVNNANLGEETTFDTLRASATFADELSKLSGLPLYANCLPVPLAEKHPECFPIQPIASPFEPTGFSN